MNNRALLFLLFTVTTSTCEHIQTRSMRSIFASLVKSISAIKSVDEYNQQVLTHQGICVVKFYAPWCSACTSIKRFYSDLAQTYSDITFYEVNISAPEGKPLIKQCGLRMLPTFFILKSGIPLELTNSDGEITDRLVGTEECPLLEKQVRLLSAHKKNTGYCWVRRSNRVRRGKSASAIPLKSTNITQ